MFWWWTRTIVSLKLQCGPWRWRWSGGYVSLWLGESLIRLYLKWPCVPFSKGLSPRKTLGHRDVPFSESKETRHKSNIGLLNYLCYYSKNNFPNTYFVLCAREWYRRNDEFLVTKTCSSKKNLWSIRPSYIIIISLQSCLHAYQLSGKLLLFVKRTKTATERNCRELPSRCSRYTCN